MIFKFSLFSKKKEQKGKERRHGQDGKCVLFPAIFCSLLHPFSWILAGAFLQGSQKFYFYFALCNCLSMWELLCKTLFKLGHSAEVCTELIMIILLPWAFLCSLNLLKYFFIAGAENLHSNKGCVAPGMLLLVGNIWHLITYNWISYN